MIRRRVEKRPERRWTSALVLALFASFALAAPEFPPLSGRVVDRAGLLSPEQVRALTNKLAAHEAATTNQVVVVTLARLQGYSIEDYGYQLGRHWGIGQKGKNNGVLLIVAVAERKVRIEVGYGLEGTLTDALSKIMIEREIVPRFKKGDMAGGLVAGTDAILAVLGGKYATPADAISRGQSTSDSLSHDSLVPLVLISLSAVLAGGFLSRIMNPTPAAGLAAGAATACAVLVTDMVVIWLIAGLSVFLIVRFVGPHLSEHGGGGDGGGGFGGFGGFGGGGGGFGGGGASGSW